MSDTTPAPVAGGADVPSLDLGCDCCGAIGRIHPYEPYVDHVRIWRSQHRHVQPDEV